MTQSAIIYPNGTLIPLNPSVTKLIYYNLIRNALRAFFLKLRRFHNSLNLNTT